MKRIAVFCPGKRVSCEGFRFETFLAELSPELEIVAFPFDELALPSKRDEFMSFVTDERIDALLCWYGGRVDGENISGSSIELVNNLTPGDWDLIQRKSPLIVGRSDCTYLQSALLNHGLKVIYGPNLSGLCDECDDRDVRVGTKEQIKYAIRHLIGALSSERFEVDFCDDELCEMGRPTIISPGTGVGRIVGGNLTTIACAYYYKCEDAVPIRQPGDIIMLEENQATYLGGWLNTDNPGPYSVETALSILDRAGFFNDISGLIFGRSAFITGVSTDAKENEAKYIAEQIIPHISTFKDSIEVPVIAGVNWGHVVPSVYFPLGCRATLDTSSMTLRFE